MDDIDFTEQLRADHAFRIVRPELIPAKRYYDPAFYELERERLWPHVWQMACRLEQIPEIGDWVEYSNLGKSVIVVRTKAGVQAFHNHCRHRGVPLAEAGGHGNCETKGFICPFHGWRWNMAGECTFVYGRHLFSEDLLATGELALRPCRVETWGGCAFVNFDDAAPSFRESMGPVLDRLEAHGVADLRAEWWFATVLPANWKIAMEAFMEGYHVMKTHPQLQQAVPELYNSRYSGEASAVGLPVNPHLTAREERPRAVRAHAAAQRGHGRDGPRQGAGDRRAVARGRPPCRSGPGGRDVVRPGARPDHQAVARPRRGRAGPQRGSASRTR